MKGRLIKTRAGVTADDTGAALVLALLVLLLVGAMLTAVMSYMATGFSLAPVERNDRNASNYVQGSVHGAINKIRGSSVYGRTGSPCPTFQPPVPSGLSGVSGHVFTVDCSALATTGSPPDDAPSFAIQTLGAAPDGIKMTGNNELYIDGGVYSAGVIAGATQAQSLMRVNGTVQAAGACTGKLASTDASGVHCSPPIATAPDPQFQPALTGQGALDTLISTGSADQYADPVPVCSGSHIVFSPGYYGTRPDVLVSTLLASCGAGVWEFTPGLYYFDYTGDWHVQGYQVVAGTVSAGQTVSSSLGGACSTTSAGVQFLFGGSGTVSTQSSSGGTVSGIELCGPPSGHSYNGAPQRIVAYGLSSDNTATTALSGPAGQQTVTASSAPGPAGSTSWLQQDNAQKIDGSVATTVGATAPFTEQKTAKLTYDFGATAVPKGARVTSVKLRVAQTLVNASSSVVLTSTRLTSPITMNLKDTDVCTTVSPCTQDVTTQLTGDVIWRLLDNLTATYTASADKDKGHSVDPHSAVLDGVDLQVTYTIPTYRQQTCAAGCTFFDSSTNPNVFMHGTVYTPLAGWSVSIHNSGESIFDRGVVMRTIAIDASASSKQTTSPFQLPHGNPGGRYVSFVGKIDGVEKVRACVQYTDQAPVPDGGLGAYYGWSVDIPHWLYERSPSSQTSSC